MTTDCTSKVDICQSEITLAIFNNWMCTEEILDLIWCWRYLITGFALVPVLLLFVSNELLPFYEDYYAVLSQNQKCETDLIVALDEGRKDITTAFLRGKGDGRQLAVDPVPELRDMMGLKDSEICLLEGNAYGRVDAPLLFYKEFRSQLEKVGFEAHPLDSCLYLLRNPYDRKLGWHLGNTR